MNNWVKVSELPDKLRRKYRAFIAKHFNGDADVCQRLPERRQLQYKPQPCLELAPCRFCQGS